MFKKKRLNRSLLKQFKTSLGPEQERLITQKDTEIEELQKSIQEDREIAEDEIAGILSGLFLTRDMSFCLMLRIQSC